MPLTLAPLQLPSRQYAARNKPQVAKAIDRRSTVDPEDAFLAAGLEVAVRAWWRGTPGRVKHSHPSRQEDDWLRSTLAESTHSSAKSRLLRCGIPERVLEGGAELADFLQQDLQVQGVWQSLQKSEATGSVLATFLAAVVDEVFHRYEIRALPPVVLRPDRKEQEMPAPTPTLVLAPRTPVPSEVSTTTPGLPRTLQGRPRPRPLGLNSSLKLRPKSHGWPSPRNPLDSPLPQPPQCASAPPIYAQEHMDSIEDFSSPRGTRGITPAAASRTGTSVTVGSSDSFKPALGSPSFTRERPWLKSRKVPTSPGAKSVPPIVKQVSIAQSAASGDSSSGEADADSSSNSFGGVGCKTAPVERHRPWVQKTLSKGKKPQSSFESWFSTVRASSQKFVEVNEEQTRTPNGRLEGTLLLTQKDNTAAPTVIKDLGDIKRIFETFDREKDLHVDEKEFPLLLSKLLRKPKSELDMGEVWRSWEEMDAGNQGKVSFDNFYTWYCGKFSIEMNPDFSMFFHEDLIGEEQKVIRDVARRCKVDEGRMDKIWREFKRLDMDGSGQLDKEEFRVLIQRELAPSGDPQVPPNVVQKFWMEVDADGDGLAKFQDFAFWYVNAFGNAGHSKMENYYRRIAGGPRISVFYDS